MTNGVISPSDQFPATPAAFVGLTVSVVPEYVPFTVRAIFGLLAVNKDPYVIDIPWYDRLMTFAAIAYEDPEEVFE